MCQIRFGPDVRAVRSAYEAMARIRKGRTPDAGLQQLRSRLDELEETNRGLRSRLEKLERHDA